MATSNPEEWELGFDGNGVPCWRHKVTKGLLYQQFPQVIPAGLSAMSASAPNVPSTPAFHKASGVASAALWKQAVAGSWKEHATEEDGKPYWHNTISGETTWEKPNMDAAGKPPPPPPPPPAAPKEPAAPKPRERERDQWEQRRIGKGRKFWYNKKTEVSQYDTPDCLRKYR